MYKPLHSNYISTETSIIAEKCYLSTCTYMSQLRNEIYPCWASPFTSSIRIYTIRYLLASLVPFGSLPSHESISFTINSFIEVLFILLLCMHVPNVGYTKSDGYKPKSHNGFVWFNEKFWIHSTEKGGGPDTSESWSSILFVFGCILLEIWRLGS